MRHGFLFLFLALVLGLAIIALPHPSRWLAAHLTAFLTGLILVVIGAGMERAAPHEWPAHAGVRDRIGRRLRRPRWKRVRGDRRFPRPGLEPGRRSAHAAGGRVLRDPRDHRSQSLCFLRPGVVRDARHCDRTVNSASASNPSSLSLRHTMVLTKARAGVKRAHERSEATSAERASV